jgi:small conductance mechanosensitive channel
MNLDAQTIQNIWKTVIEHAIAFGPKVVTALAIMVAGYFAGRWVGRLVDRWLAKVEMDPPLRLLLIRVVRVGVLAVFLMLALQNLGVQLLPLIAGLGVAGVGLGLAMQGVLGNLVAGLTIIFTRPFRVGEYVSMLGVEGEVETIDLFTTRLSHPDRSIVVVPNRKIVGEILHNYGSIRQIEIVVGVSYATNLDQAVAAVRAVLRGNPRVLPEPAPLVRVVATADSAINLAVQPWVKVPDYIPVIGELNQAIVEKFREAKIEMPFPQREVRILDGSAA